MRLPDEADGKQRRGEIADQRDEANDRIQADPIVRARHDEGRVEQLGRTPQRRQPRLLCCL